MTKSELALHVLACVSNTKQPPLTRWRLLLLIAAQPNLLPAQMAKHLAEDRAYLATPLERCLKLGLVTMNNLGRYNITPEGEDIVRPLLDPQILPAL